MNVKGRISADRERFSATARIVECAAVHKEHADCALTPPGSEQNAVSSSSSVCAEEIPPDFKPGDVCIYSFGDKNKSRAVVEVVRILDDDRGVAEIKFHEVLADDTGNGYFLFLQRTGNTMNASLKYLQKREHGQSLRIIESDTSIESSGGGRCEGN